MAEVQDTTENISSVKYFQGLDELSANKSDADSLKLIKQKISDLSNMKNIHFLFGAGISAGAIPTMKEFIVEIEAKIKDKPQQAETFKKLKENKNENLEDILGILYSKRDYQLGIKVDDKDTDDLIEIIEQTIFEKINIDLSDASYKAVVDTYKTFYQKVTYRNKDLSRVNIFTTNNDLFNERVLDNLNINYNNGFGGGLDRFFNPARFGYTFSKKIETSIEKYEALDNMIYLYKLHGSINWIEKEGNSLFNIQEIDIRHKGTKPSESVLIYPNPLKQSKSLSSPYTDIIREFQKKLLLQNSVLFIIGYSFSDDHLNNIIYQALSSNSSISIVIFGNYDKPIFKIDDKRIYKIYGLDESVLSDNVNDKKIHFFKYIVDKFIPNLNENKDVNILKEFIEKLDVAKEQKLPEAKEQKL